MSLGACIHVLTREQSCLERYGNIKEISTIHVYDGTMNSIVKALKGSNPDIVYHLASLFISEHQSDDITRLIDSNIVLGVQLLESMDRLNIQNLINTGTSWQNFNGGTYDPVNLYAATKQAFEDILKYYTVSNKILKVITLKLFDTYGPGDKRGKIIPLLKQSIGSSNTIQLSPGDQFLDLVYIEDVVGAFVHAGSMLLSGKHHTPFSCYSVASGQPVKLKDLVLLIEKVCKCKVNVNLGGRPYRVREVMEVRVADKVLPGWRPRIELESGLRRVVFE